MTELDSLVRRMPFWKPNLTVNAERIGGLTNENYRLTVGDESYALRINGENAGALGIDREAEVRALKIVSAAGLGPELIARLEPEGYIVTRWIDGVHWDAPEFRTPERVSLLTDTVRRIHALPSNGAAFSPFNRVRQRADTSPWLAFCHNDLVCVNYLYCARDGAIRVLDWEFSGMGDIYYDLAAIVYTHDSEGAIPDNLENLMLERYFGEPVDSLGFGARKQRLADMKFALMLFTCLWGFVQNALVRAGKIPAVPDFDYREFGEEMLKLEVLPLGKRV